MGLLDDAIRQHLELKRQHGAAEEELQRQEEEALGPARREVAPADVSGGEGEIELEAAEAAEDSLAAEADHEAHEEETALQEPESLLEEQETDTAAELDAPAQPESIAEPGPLPEPVAEPDAPYDAAAEIPGLEEDEVAEEEALEPPGVEDDEQDLFHEEDEDGPQEGEPEASDADVLEDTPDFLQETPEHDRLWFEQKPPRDFDFD
jgi:hypothetical protein